MGKSNSPRIRFKGFTEPWEQRKLGDVVNIGNGRDYKHLTVGKIPVYGTGGLMLYVNQAICNEDAIGIGRKGTIDKPQYLKAPFWTVDTLFYMVSLQKQPLFIFAYSQFIPWLNYNQATGVPSLTKDQISDIKIGVPSINEQEKIGSLFLYIDYLITLHQRKCDRLKKVKQGLLEKMFPTEKEDTPKIRFKGFTEPWEQRKFGDEVKLRRGLTYSPSNITKDGVRVLRSSNIDEEYFVASEDDVFVKRECVNIPYCKSGDILVTAANGSSKLVGKHAVLQGLLENSAVHGGFMILGESNNPTFINASMSSSWYAKFINLHVAGGNGAIGNLNKNDLENQPVLFPNSEEQVKIGKLFEDLDELITLHQRKCKKLKNIKSALLERMFV